jgi:ArsR family transcriptional regulator, arsenate/arsenite/antimonite-responsive transcriptional repressor
MEKDHVVAALAALAQDNRLDVFRLLVKAGPEGLAAGQVAKALGIPPNTLTFHFDRLRQAGLIAVRRASRSMIYTAQFETMHGLVDFLTENCCAGVADECGPSCATPASTSKTQSKTGAKKHEPAR